MSEDLKQLAGKIIEEAYNKGNLNVLDELVDPIVNIARSISHSTILPWNMVYVTKP